jgi:hypothetical protein
MQDTFLTETGDMVACGTYDDDDEPGCSPGMYLGPEAERVDSNRIHLISRFLNVDRESDMAAIARFVERVNPPMEFLCQRGFDLARLGGDGLTRYCMDIMHADALIYQELTQYFAHKQAHCLRQTRALADEMSTVNGTLAAFERQTANFRQDSSQSSTNQSQLNSSRRHLQRLQAQANGHLIGSGYIRSGTTGSTLSSLPPLQPPSSRHPSTAPGSQQSAPVHHHNGTVHPPLGEVGRSGSLAHRGFGGFGDGSFDESKFGE